MAQPTPLHPRDLWGKNASEHEIRRALAESKLNSGLFTLCIANANGRKAWHSYTAFFTPRGELRTRFGGDRHQSCPIARRYAIAEQRYRDSAGLTDAVLGTYPLDPQPLKPEYPALLRIFPSTRETAVLSPPTPAHQLFPHSYSEKSKAHQEHEEEWEDPFTFGAMDNSSSLSSGKHWLSNAGAIIFCSCMGGAIIIALVGRHFQNSAASAHPGISSHISLFSIFMVSGMIALIMYQRNKEARALGEGKYRLRKYSHLGHSASENSSLMNTQAVPLFKSGLFYGIVGVIELIVFLDWVIQNYPFNHLH